MLRAHARSARAVLIYAPSPSLLCIAIVANPESAAPVIEAVLVVLAVVLALVLALEDPAMVVVALALFIEAPAMVVEGQVAVYPGVLVAGTEDFINGDRRPLIEETIVRIQKIIGVRHASLHSCLHVLNE